MPPDPLPPAVPAWLQAAAQAVRGRIRYGAPLANVTWFRVGGPAEVLFKPEDADDLATFLRHKPADMPVLVLGVGSNLLVRDGGIPLSMGVVVRLGRGFTDITTAGDQLTAGAAVLDVHLAQVAADAGLAGLEFLAGIPGTLGGAVAMNAGAYGRELRDVLICTDVLDAHGQRHTLTAKELGFRYRHSALPPGWTIVAATLRGVRDTTLPPAQASAAIAARIAEIQAARQATQPVRARTGGSTFTNPPGHKAWELIDRAGCRGLRRGGAQVSELHCNFLLNTTDATRGDTTQGDATAGDPPCTASDLEALGEEVRRRVLAATGVQLEWEIRRIGVPCPVPAP